MKEAIIGTIATLVLAAIVTAIMMVPVYLIDVNKCSTLSATSDLRTEYTGFFTGCYIEVNGRFIPQENWRGEYEK